MLDTTETATASRGAPGDQAHMTSHFAGVLCGTVAGALGTLDLLRADISRTAETMDEGGKASGWAAVIGLVTDALTEPHLDLEQCLGARAEGRAAVAPAGDAELTSICAQHIVNMEAFNNAPSDGGPEYEGNPLWAAYVAKRDLITQAKPKTMEGVLAIARAAVAENGGKEPCFHGPDEEWSWGVVTALLRLHGRL